MEQNRPAPRRALSPKERRRRHRIRLVRNWTVFLLSCGAVMAVMTGGILWLLPRAYALIAPPTAFEAREYEGGAETDLSDKRLVLVNANLPLTEEPTPELAVADDTTGASLEAEAAAAYREMAEAARRDEIELVLTAGYQDAAARQSAYEAAVQSCRESGCSEEEAAVRAATVQPAPEVSEYATGYGADILAADSMEKDTGFADTRAYEWLEAYAAEHGFILRWPQERQAATGMVFEPWHWRYVGRDNALAIRASGLSLEEYLALEQTK
ncbi:M15 family metallopeptidase [Faecalibacterium prausnitzii]|uniref:M15 family metallopeptidase n=1 Tax=Faecalibacterium prausnitzii TaxID=853 RepID=UPI00130E9EDC|nr:M15 family metallopeptidase [Faecalibacterium prausnitzii]